MLTEFCQENVLVISNNLFLQHKRRLYTWTSPDGPHQIRFIISFAAKDGEAMYSQQKQDQKRAVAQIMNSLLPNSDLNWRKWGKPLEHSGMTYIKSLMNVYLHQNTLCKNLHNYKEKRKDHYFTWRLHHPLFVSDRSSGQKTSENVIALNSTIGQLT